MAFYDLPKEQRSSLVLDIKMGIAKDLEHNASAAIRTLFADEDTYIRKAAYLSYGRLYQERRDRKLMLSLLMDLLLDTDSRIRQTSVNAAGEIGKIDFEQVSTVFDTGLFDPHHSVRNAVIGSVKKMAEVNPVVVLAWAKLYLHHPDKEIRREICHGIELRGRKQPEDILPLLQALEWDTAARVRNTLVHVAGQIAYKRGCLEKVVLALASWGNKALVQLILDEIIDVHHRYRNFSYYTQDEAREYIRLHYTGA